LSAVRRRLNVTLSFLIFLALLFVAAVPFQVSLRQMALIEDRTIISVAGIEVTNSDIITVSSLAAGAIALSTFFTEVVLPQTRRIRRRR